MYGTLNKMLYLLWHLQKQWFLSKKSQVFLGIDCDIIVNFEHISYLVPVFLLLTLKM